MREDLGMSPGKLAAQTAHASLSAYDKAERQDIDAWKRTGTTKVVLSAFSETELLALYKEAVSKYLPACIVADEGRTEVTPGTITGIAIGPAASDAIDYVTGHLKLYGKSEANVS